MALEISEEDAISCILEVNTVESEDIDIAALMKRYQGSLSVSMSGESLSLKQGGSADISVKETDEQDDLDEDEYAARANEIMQRYKMQYAASDDTEQSSESSDAYNAKKEESKADADEAETFRECMDRAVELINKSRQILELSEVDGEKEEKEVEVVDAEVVDLVENDAIGEKMSSKVESEKVEDDVHEQVESRMLEEEENDEERQCESESGSAEEKDDPDEVEIGEKIQEEEVEASNANAISTSNSATKVANIVDESEDLEEMITKLTLENEALKKKRELERRMYELSQENDKLKLYTQRNAAGEKDNPDEVEIGEKIQEKEVEASNAKAVSTSNSATKVANIVDESEDLEEMITKLTLENEALKKKRELKKRIYELSQENDKLKIDTQRNALAKMAIKFDDAVKNAVAKVSKIMVCDCAPDNALLDFHSVDAIQPDTKGGVPEMSDGDENGNCVLDSEPALCRRLEYKQVEVLSPISHLTENTNYFRSAPAPPNSYQLKMQAYNEKYQDSIKSKSSASVNLASFSSGVAIDDGVDNALRRIEEAKMQAYNEECQDSINPKSSASVDDVLKEARLASGVAIDDGLGNA